MFDVDQRLSTLQIHMRASAPLGPEADCHTVVEYSDADNTGLAESKTASGQAEGRFKTRRSHGDDERFANVL